MNAMEAAITFVANGNACAWLLHSHRLGRSFWLCLDATAVAQLEAAHARRGLPVLCAGFDRALTDALLDALIIFPGAPAEQV